VAGVRAGAPRVRATTEGSPLSSAHAFTTALIVGSALLALWIQWRYARLRPTTVVSALLHVGAACVLLRLLPLVLPEASGSGIALFVYVEIFALALPALVYAFLSGAWLTRLAVGMLRP
jgi:hypothetical protein